MNKLIALKYVDLICNTKSTNCRSTNKISLALKLMQLGKIPTDGIEIYEIPLDWSRQVVVNYVAKNGSFREFFSGIDNNGKFCYEDYVDKYRDKYGYYVDPEQPNEGSFCTGGIEHYIFYTGDEHEIRIITNSNSDYNILFTGSYDQCKTFEHSLYEENFEYDMKS